MPSSHLILCRPLLLLPSIFPSIRVFSNESVLRIRWPKYWNFSFSINPFNEYSGLISFRMIDWFDLLAVQGALESPPQQHSSKASILQRSAYFSVMIERKHKDIQNDRTGAGRALRHQWVQLPHFTNKETEAKEEKWTSGSSPLTASQNNRRVSMCQDIWLILGLGENLGGVPAFSTP